MSYLPRSLLLLFLIPMLASCSGIEVSADYPPETDFTKFHTFVWLPDSEPSDRARALGVSDLLLERMRESIEDQLTRKGLVRLDKEEEDKSDLFVTMYISIQQKLEFNDPYYSYDRVRTYEKGALVIDLIDAKNKNVVWTGHGATRIRYYPTPEERKTRVRDVVQAILAQYPPSK